MDELRVRDRLRQFVLTQLPWAGSPAELTSEYPLMDNVLDSVGIFEIVGYVESEFGIEILDEDLVPENFTSISSIAHLVLSKRPSQSSDDPR
jgi:acyl carrier protein